MDKPLLGMKTAILAASGCMEKQILESQRALLSAGATASIVSVGSGLITSLSDGGWGHNFAVDQAIGSALAADYDMLIIVDGFSSHDKFKNTAHTKRFVGGFMMAHKPVAIFNGALDMMIDMDMIKNYYVAGSDKMKNKAEEVGALWSMDDMCLWGNMLSGNADDRDKFISMMMDHFIASTSDKSMAEAA